MEIYPLARKCFILATNSLIFRQLPTFDCKIFAFSKIIPFYYPKTKFKHTLTFFGFATISMEFLSIVKCHNIVKVQKLKDKIMHEWFT